MRYSLALISLLAIALASCGHNIRTTREESQLIELTSGTVDDQRRTPEVQLDTSPTVTERKTDRSASASTSGTPAQAAATTPTATQQQRLLLLRLQDVFGRQPRLPAQRPPRSPR